MHNIILSSTISNHTINHIKSSNIISDWQWYRLEEKEREREPQKEIPTDWESVWKVKSVVLFYSCILLLWYVGYDDFTSMNNVFVLLIIISLLVLLLANMKIAILEKYLFSISDDFLHFFLFFHFIYFCISSIYIFLINFSSLFLLFLFSSIFILSLTLSL